MTVIECKANHWGKDGLQGQKISAQGNTLDNLNRQEVDAPCKDKKVNGELGNEILTRLQGQGGYDSYGFPSIITSFFSSANAAIFRQQAINAGFKKNRVEKGLIIRGAPICYRWFLK